MTSYVQQLYPQPIGDGQTRTRPLNGLYLSHRLHRFGAAGRPFVYANFVASLDGRIALDTERPGISSVPESLTTEGDWSLFQELQAQADCFVTHGGYLRALAEGRLDDILQVGTAAGTEHLQQWRQANDLPPQPAIVVVSNSLNFAIPPSIKANAQKFYIVTTEAGDRTKVKLWRTKGFEVIFAGSGNLVEGRPLFDLLSELGFRSAYLQAGPLLLAAMLRDGLLDRLYLTQSHQLLGGDGFQTIMAGPSVGDAAGRNLKLESLYFDPESERGTGQFFCCFERA